MEGLAFIIMLAAICVVVLVFVGVVVFVCNSMDWVRRKLGFEETEGVHAVMLLAFLPYLVTVVAVIGAVGHWIVTTIAG